MTTNCTTPGCTGTAVPRVKRASAWRGLCATCAAPVRRQARAAYRNTPARTGQGIEGMIRGLGRQAAAGEPAALEALAGIAAALAAAQGEGVAGMRALGQADLGIAQAMGVSRQALGQRFGRRGEAGAVAVKAYGLPPVPQPPLLQGRSA